MTTRSQWQQGALWRDVMASRLSTAYEALGEAVAGAPISNERLHAERAQAEVKRALNMARDGAAECRERAGVEPEFVR